MTASGPPDMETMIWARKIKIERDARKHFHCFGPAVVRDKDDHPVEFDLLHLSWIAHLEYCWSRNQHAGIFTTRSSSGFISLLASWLIGSDVQRHVKIVCANESHARLRMRIVKGIVTSPAYAEVFPGAVQGERWNDHTMFIEHTGQAIEPLVEAAGMSVKAAGGDITHLLFDSVVDAENSSSFERRESQKRMVDNLWMSRLSPGGKVLWIAAPINPDDTSYAMRSRPDFWWLEQRLRSDGEGYEQEVYGAPADYLEKTRGALLEMLEWK